jgi:rubrerythrin
MSRGLTRRSALVAAAVGLSSCGGEDEPSPRGPRPGSGVALLNSLLALEHAAVAAYGALTGRLEGRARAAARVIREQERHHVRLLTETIDGVGGTPVAGRTPAEYAPLFPRLRDHEDALLLARDLEERLVRAYLEALADLPAGPLRRTVAGLATSESEHLAVVHGLHGDPVAAQAFVTGTS